MFMYVCERNEQMQSQLEFAPVNVLFLNIDAQKGHKKISGNTSHLE